MIPYIKPTQTEDHCEFRTEWLQLPVFQIFKQVVSQYPEKIAITDSARQYSYLEVYAFAVAIAKATRPFSQPGEPIGIALKNDASFPIAMLAALAIGCPYVPLDISFPVSRNELIVQLSGIKTIISSADLPSLTTNLNIVNIDELTIEPTEHPPFEPDATADSIAYIIYTSGSTGIPKGVFQNQRNLLHDVMQYTNSICISPRDRLTLLYSPSVNGAIRDIYGALLNGASLHILNLKETGLHRLPEFIKQQKITVYHSIPPIFRTFLKLNSTGFDFSSIRMIYLAGDRIFNSDVLLYRRYFPSNCLLYVGIGSTEIATIYRQWFINHDTPIQQERIPVGFPVEDRTMELISPDNKKVSPGDTGEIVVSSAFISLGYWNDPVRTQQSYMANGMIRTFKTGDLGRINEDGLLEFIGRKDNQIKINGYRIEISEIEGALLTHPSIDHCAVVAHASLSSSFLAVFYKSNEPLDEQALRKWLASSLPHYMIPHQWIRLDEIPVLPNFKNDYTSLSKQLDQDYLKENQDVTPDTNEPALLQLLRKTWAAFLDEESFNQNTSWSNAGGTSLNAVNFLVQLEASLSTSLPDEWIHGDMRPLEIYDYLSRRSSDEQSVSEKIIYYFPPITGLTEKARSFIQSLSKHVSVQIIKYPDFTNLTFQESNWDYIRSYIQRQVPVVNHPHTGFLSNCNGGIVMGNFIGHLPLSSYWFVGVIDGHLSYQKPPIYVNFLKRLTSLFHGNLISRLNTFFYTSLPLYQILTDTFRQSQVTKNDPALMTTYLLTHNTHPFAGEVWYFKCEHSPFEASTEKWKDACSQVHQITVKGAHGKMFDPENTELIKNTILSIQPPATGPAV